ncbi:MAG: 30S ribosomal protein S9 [Thermoprotei archaeon]|nr:30S ribosomal protein S9 [Thermoprotei archaeon]
MTRIVIAVGKKKSAIARAVIKPGKGRVRINNIPVEIYTPEMARWKILEPLLLAGDLRNKVDIYVNVKGGGWMGQATAARMAIARGLIEWSQSEELKKIYLEYDRSMLAGDPRRPEPKKPRGRSARSKRQKSYR